MSNEDAEYYSQRAQAEHELAQKATRPEVVSAHYQLAEAYLEKAAEAEQTDVTNEKSSRDSYPSARVSSSVSRSRDTSATMSRRVRTAASTASRSSVSIR